MTGKGLGLGVAAGDATKNNYPERVEKVKPIPDHERNESWDPIDFLERVMEIRKMQRKELYPAWVR